MRQTKVSFIIPIFNAEKYLAHCLDSVVNQSERNIEIICINDCSPDSSFEILQSYAEYDTRFKIINFETNRGPGAARNAGIEAATGEYIRMVDCDDYLPLDSTEKLIDAADQYNSNFVRGGYWHCSAQGELLKKSWDYPKELTIGTNIREDNTLWGVDQHWAYLYRTKSLLATGVKYDESMRNAQDAAFKVDLMPHMVNVTSISETVYFYRNNPGSITRKQRDAGFFCNVLSIYERGHNHLNENNLREIADHNFYLALCHYLPNAIFPTISEDLQYENAKEVLLYLKTLLDKYEPQKLCFDTRHSWQEFRTSKLPVEVKYVILLLQKGNLLEAYNNLDSFSKRIEKEQKLQMQLNRSKNKLNAIQRSTSWKITSPLRQITDKVKALKYKKALRNSERN